ncbi:MAG: DUF547 domain-containing protein [Thermoanaerobaculia bacterium]
MKKHFAIAGFLLALSACTSVPPPRAAPEFEASPEAWAAVLSRHVDERGRIAFAAAAASPRELEAFVAWIATTSPASDPAAFPTKEARLAYWLNAYNALAMYNVIRSGIPPELGSIKVRFFGLTTFTIGGKSMSLNTLETKIVRPIGDPRVHFALNCMVRGCPRLPREPFAAPRLEEQLEAAARFFLNEERNVKLLPDRSTVRFSDILRFYTADFLKQAPSLAAYANRYRDSEIPAGWKEEFIPYDWVVNAQ